MSNEEKKEFPHYYKSIEHLAEDGYMDVYDVLDIFEVNNPAIAHAVKKMLVTGKRGHKDEVRDIKDAISTLNRALTLVQNKAKNNL